MGARARTTHIGQRPVRDSRADQAPQLVVMPRKPGRWSLAAGTIALFVQECRLFPEGAPGREGANRERARPS